MRKYEALHITRAKAHVVRRQRGAGRRAPRSLARPRAGRPRPAPRVPFRPFIWARVPPGGAMGWALYETLVLTMTLFTRFTNSYNVTRHSPRESRRRGAQQCTQHAHRSSYDSNTDRRESKPPGPGGSGEHRARVQNDSARADELSHVPPPCSRRIINLHITPQNVRPAMPEVHPVLCMHRAQPA
jgi:hypothetical protein